PYGTREPVSAVSAARTGRDAVAPRGVRPQYATRIGGRRAASPSRHTGRSLGMAVARARCTLPVGAGVCERRRVVGVRTRRCGEAVRGRALRLALRGPLAQRAPPLVQHGG